jgi:hypothetical protein
MTRTLKAYLKAEKKRKKEVWNNYFKEMGIK